MYMTRAQQRDYLRETYGIPLGKGRVGKHGIRRRGTSLRHDRRACTLDARVAGHVGSKMRQHVRRGRGNRSAPPSATRSLRPNTPIPITTMPQRSYQGFR